VLGAGRISERAGQRLEAALQNEKTALESTPRHERTALESAPRNEKTAAAVRDQRTD
jgi:hypothetical protein